MLSRLIPTRKRATEPIEDIRLVPPMPVADRAVPREIRKPTSQRQIVIVHPDARDAYRLKARLLREGHRRIELFFQPESLLQLLAQGYRPDVVFTDEFSPADAGMTASELARRLRRERGYAGLLYSTAAEALSDQMVVDGFSGASADYFAA